MRGRPAKKCSVASDEESDNDSSPCVDCKTEICASDMALQCDLCDNWFCNTNCLKLNKASYERIGKSKNNEGIMWFCHHCRVSFPSMRKVLMKLGDLEKNQNELRQKVEKLEKEGIGKAVEKVLETRGVNRPGETGKQGTSNVLDLVTEVMAEQQDRDNRRLNVVCFGLPESKADFEHRQDDDKDRIKAVIKDVMKLENIEIVDGPFRLGKYDKTKTRPVKIKLGSLEQKEKVIEASYSKVRKSKEEICQRLYFQRDLTYRQRQEEYERRARRRQRPPTGPVTDRGGAPDSP